MNRQAINNGTWFDHDSATRYEEGSSWNGSNTISLATGSQWDHEWLHKTAGGAWILESYSARDSVVDRYDRVSASDAASWLVRNEHPIPKSLIGYVALTEV
jgi:hypothetical protein